MANFDLNKLMEGKNPQSVMLAETRGLKNKWEKTGLLEGLQERDQHQMSVLLENQAKQLLDEANATSNGSGNEEWNGVALPLVRRIFGEIAAKNFVSVQPMNLPSGLIFYLDFKYNNQQFGGTTYSGSSLFGGDGSDLGSTNVAKNGLYGGGRYGYTLNDQSVDVVAANTTVATASLSDVNFDNNMSASILANELIKVTVAKSNISSTADDDAIKAFTIDSASSAIALRALCRLPCSSDHAPEPCLVCTTRDPHIPQGSSQQNRVPRPSDFEQAYGPYRCFLAEHAGSRPRPQTEPLPREFRPLRRRAPPLRQQDWGESHGMTSCGSAATNMPPRDRGPQESEDSDAADKPPHRPDGSPGVPPRPSYAELRRCSLENQRPRYDGKVLWQGAPLHR